MHSIKIFGHSNPLKQLGILIKSGKIPPSMIFNGIKGTGKFLVAKEFAKTINCEPEKQTGEKSDILFPPQLEKKEETGKKGVSPCHQCVSCRQIEAGAHPDVRIIDKEFQAALKKEKASKQQTVRIETIREVSKYAGQRPILSKNKVFIIDDADTMVLPAQNAILKILEEPPENTYFILISSRKSFFLPTILSRCHIVEFGQLPDNLVEEILTRNDIPLKEASFLSKVSGGSVDKAFQIKNMLSSMDKFDPGDRTYAIRIASSLPKESNIARDRARLMLDIFLSKTHKIWIKSFKNAAKRDLEFLISDLLKFKNLLDKNVSPSTITELAALKCLKYNITLSFNE